MNTSAENHEPATAFFGRRIEQDLELSAAQLQAVAFLDRSARSQEQLAALTGPAGSGKTVALNAALTRLESSGCQIVRISNFLAGPLNMHRTIAGYFGVARAGELSADEIDRALREALADSGTANPPVLAVDDAQSLLPETLRYLSLLTGRRDGGRPHFRVLLVGRPGSAELDAIPLHFRMQAVSPDDATRLLRHGLVATGANASDEAVQDLVERAGGNLRVLDSLLRHREERSQTRAPDREQGRTDTVGPDLATRRFAWSSLAIPASLALGIASAVVTFHYRQAAKPQASVQVESGKPVIGPQVGRLPPPPSPKVAIRQPAEPLLQPEPPPVAVQPRPTKPNEEESVHSPAALAFVQPALVPPPAPAPPTPAVSPLVNEGPTEGIRGPGSVPSQINPPPLHPTSPPVPHPALTHFRVFNSGSCLSNVCRHWQVFDLDHRKQFVAALDISALDLDFDTAFKSREGEVELFITGSVKTGAGGARLVVARMLQTVKAHRAKSSGPEPEKPALPPPGEEVPPSGSGEWTKLLAPSVESDKSSAPAVTPQPGSTASPVDLKPAEARGWAAGIDRSPPPGNLEVPSRKPAAITNPPVAAITRPGLDVATSTAISVVPAPSPLAPPPAPSDQPQTAGVKAPSHNAWFSDPATSTPAPNSSPSDQASPAVQRSASGP